jgi:[acyl-carrier-protein] S-malonyltransferase
MGVALRAAPFGDHAQRVPVYANVTAAKVTAATEWPSLLESQLVSPVRWTESVRAMVADGVKTYVECGAGEVLCGLLRRIEPEASGLKVVDEATLLEAVSQIGGVTV